MSTVYRLKASEIGSKFLEEIKANFGNQEIEIVISEFDETEYLLKSEANKKRLLSAAENIKNRENLVDTKSGLKKLPSPASRVETLHATSLQDLIGTVLPNI